MLKAAISIAVITANFLFVLQLAIPSLPYTLNTER